MMWVTLSPRPNCGGGVKMLARAGMVGLFGWGRDEVVSLGRDEGGYMGGGGEVVSQGRDGGVVWVGQG